MTTPPPHEAPAQADAQQRPVDQCWNDPCSEPRTGDNPFCSQLCAEQDQTATAQYLVEQREQLAESIRTNPF
jgi:hypothetical protein